MAYLVEFAHGPLDFLLVLLVLMLIWWMYASYEWLTNEAGAQRSMRLMLIAAMAGFLVMALALPRIFGADGLTFGLAYLFGDVVFRWVMGIGPVIIRALGAAIALTLGVVGPLWGGEASLGAAAALVIALLVIEQGLERGKKNPPYEGWRCQREKRS